MILIVEILINTKKSLILCMGDFMINKKRHGIYIVDNEPVDYNHWYCTILWTDNEGVLQREELTPTDDYNKAVDFALIRALTKITNDGKTEKTQG